MESSDIVSRRVRWRVNIKISTKGQVTWDSTVEVTDGDETGMEDVLQRSDALVAALNRRYPPSEGI